MSKKCVVNYSKNSWNIPWYKAGQERLEDSLKEVGFDGDLILFTDDSELGCPPHSKIPYAFKPYALREVARRGYELVLWCDASVWAIKPIQPLFDIIEKQGHMFWYNGWCDTWTSDACMKAFGICREQLKITPHLQGICMGWDMRRPKCQVFLERWLAKADDGVSFPGAWTNNNHEVSHDPGVKGHRHDQAVASILAWQLDMNTLISQDHGFEYYRNPQSTPYAINPTLELVNPTSVMIAQGI